MLLLENSKEAMVSEDLVNQPFHLTTLLLYMEDLSLHEDMQEGKLGGMLGYEKGINIFLFPTFHDIILIDFSVI
jgi:hypothetical protein